MPLSTLNHSVYKKFSFPDSFALMESSFPEADRSDFYLSFSNQLVFYLVCFGFLLGYKIDEGWRFIIECLCEFLGWIFEFAEWYSSASSVLVRR